MHTIYHPGHVRHDAKKLHKAGTPNNNVYYSEVSERGEAIYRSVAEASLGPVMPPGDFGNEPIEEVHDHGMIRLLKTAFQRMQQEEKAGVALPRTFNLRDQQSQRTPRSIWGQLGKYCFDIGSPIFNHTWEVAYWSAQTAITAGALVASGEKQTSYALCRPPGHHAAARYYGGFCYLNNVAITANWLAHQGQRVAILDVDYHHGNGTQEIFYRRSDVFVCSIHADPLNEYPYFWGYADEFGDGSGENYNFNYPLPRGTEQAAYLDAFDHAVDRVKRFVPSILMVSLGLDTLAGDPIGDFNLTQESMSLIGERLCASGIPCVVVQEGGYNLETVGPGVVSFLKALIGS